ncbi:hypothetical protein KAR91_16065 [Candidatus Pacearchaeota archaeon]|nr:hypothetical protein [Candidatus Pacearchaeota archaeon]
MLKTYLEDLQERENVNEELMVGLFFTSLILLLIALGLKGSRKEIQDIAKRVMQKIIPIIEEEEKRNFPKLHIIGSSLFRFLSLRTKELSLIWNKHDPKRLISRELMNRKKYPENTKKLIQEEITKIAKTYHRKGKMFSKDVNRGKVKIDVLYFSDGDGPFNLDMVKEDFYRATVDNDDPHLFKQIDLMIKAIDYANDNASKILNTVLTRVFEELSRYL